jgi:hypothetical protein
MADDSKITEDIRNYIRHRTHDDLLMQKFGACYEELESLCDDLFHAGRLKPVDEPHLQSGRKRISARRHGDPIPEGSSS